MRWSRSPKYDGGHRGRNRIVAGSSRLVSRAPRGLPCDLSSSPRPNGFLLCKSLSSTSPPRTLPPLLLSPGCCATSHHLRKAILPGVSLTIQAEICIATPRGLCRPRHFSRAFLIALQQHSHSSHHIATCEGVIESASIVFTAPSAYYTRAYSGHSHGRIA